MPLLIPPELKKIIPFVRRAEELDKDKTSPESRLVAYYCRQYAVHIGIPLSSSSPEAKTCLGLLLGNLEQEKPAMDNFTRDEASLLCRRFANAVFDKADSDDRAGNASKDTAKAFYAAASFLQILEQFSDDNDTSEEVTENKRRIIYAKWKATEILKAIKEGRQPTPGGYGEDMEIDIPIANDLIDANESVKRNPLPIPVTVVNEDDDDEVQTTQQKADFDLLPPEAPTTRMRPLGSSISPTSATSDNKLESHGIGDEEGTEIELGPPPAYPGESISEAIQYNADQLKVSFSLPPPVESTPNPPVKPRDVAPKQPSPKPQKTSLFSFGKKQGKASKAQITDATELTRFALAALENKDAELAAERLQQALQALGR